MPSPDIPLRVGNGEYLVLPVRLPPLPSFPESATHYFYARPHAPQHSDVKTPRALFLANMPIDANDILLKHLLSDQLGLPAGRIQSVEFLDPRGRPAAMSEARAVPETTRNKKRKRQDLEEAAAAEISVTLPSTWDRTVHKAGTNAVVVFVDRASRDAALKALAVAAKQSKTITWGEGVTREMPALGAQRYLTHLELSYPPQHDLIRTVNDYMTAYAEREAAQTRLAARKRQEPDEDGFVTVTRGGKTGVARKEQAAHRGEREKERNRGYDDFYRFQFREQRKHQATELIRQFEADKEKVRKMKEQRRNFRPE